MANPRGPLASKNNLTGTTQVDVPLSGTTAKTWTHNFNAYPVKVEMFLGGVPVEQGSVAVTTGANSITLTPNTFTNTITVLITWCMPSQVLNGVPTSNFA